MIAGPCLLGASVNKVLGRERNMAYEAGDLYPLVNSTSANSGSRNNAKPKIPGRTIILEQNRRDMGVHSFVFSEKNLIIAATDLSDYDDRTKLDNGSNRHYSKIRNNSDVYGVTGLYFNRNITHERIIFRET